VYDADANGDGVIDWIANSGLTDANNNGTPDEWEIDTDGDGLADVYDTDANGDGVIDWIANSGLTDKNNNGTPDEWEIEIDASQKENNTVSDDTDAIVDSNDDFINSSDSSRTQVKEVINLNFYPNVFNDFINAEFTTENESNVTIEMHATNGALLFKQTIQSDKGSNKVNINTENFEKGYYLISVSTENGETQVRKVLK
jgi:hypothetical protein